MLDKISDSWNLIKSSACVLRSDKELLVLPVFSFLASTLVIASLFVSMSALSGIFKVEADDAFPRLVLIVGMFAFYFVQFSIIIFFNAALVAAAEERFSGGDPTLKSALSAAWSAIGPILGYTLIASSVGLLLRAIEQRGGALAGRFFSGLLGLGWTAITFLVVPILVNRHIGPVDAVKESARMLRTTWGQNLAGTVGIGAAFAIASVFLVLAGMALLMLVFPLSTVAGVILAVLLVLTAVGLGIYQAALTGVYQAAVYRFAQTGSAPQGFDDQQLREAFIHRG